MANSNISQVVHVAGTPDQLWRALTDPDVLRECWGATDAGGRTQPIDGARNAIQFVDVIVAD
jgi:hypothetical protein